MGDAKQIPQIHFRMFESLRNAQLKRIPAAKVAEILAKSSMS